MYYVETICIDGTHEECQVYFCETHTTMHETLNKTQGKRFLISEVTLVKSNII